MNEKAISQYLSFILRHKPEEIGLTLDREGWANIEE
ncbi:RNA 2'-phosphotransferase, partial [Acinetobacter baumannii]